MSTLISHDISPRANTTRALAIQESTSTHCTSWHYSQNSTQSADRTVSSFVSTRQHSTEKMRWNPIAMKNIMSKARCKPGPDVPCQSAQTDKSSIAYPGQVGKPYLVPSELFRQAWPPKLPPAPSTEDGGRRRFCFNYRIIMPWLCQSISTGDKITQERDWNWWLQNGP